MWSFRPRKSSARRNSWPASFRRQFVPTVYRLEDRTVPSGTQFVQGVAFVDSPTGANHNGMLDAGETPLLGATMLLYNYSGATPVFQQLTTTDGSGSYRFTGLDAGHYRLIELPPAGYVATNVQTDLATVWSPTKPAGTFDTVDFTLSAAPLTTEFTSAGLGFGTVTNPTLTRVTINPAIPQSSPNADPDIAASASGRRVEPAEELNMLLDGGSLPAGGYTYVSFCTDLTRSLLNLTPFGITSSATPVPPTLAANAGRIGYLYNHFGFALGGQHSSAMTSDADAAALQLAIWELCYDLPSDNYPAGQDLEAGNFFFRAIQGQPDFSADATSSAIRSRAYQFLQAAVGKSEPVIFLDGPAVSGQMTLLPGSLNFANGPGPQTSTSIIHLVKLTNGTDNNDPTGPVVPVGSTVTWTYNVSSTSSVLSLDNVTVTDDHLGVSPVYVFGDANNNGRIDPGETWTYTATGMATAGQYENEGTATGTAVFPDGTPQTGLPPQSDIDVDHYFGYTTNISVVKKTNNSDNNAAPGVYVPVGSPVTWTYAVSTTGNVPLGGVTVTDSVAGVTPVYQSGDNHNIGFLDPDETWLYAAAGTAIVGPYSNVGTAGGNPVTPAGGAIPGADHQTATDVDHYYGLKANPAISTTASVGGIVGTAALTDMAHLAGGYGTLGGTITFTLTDPSGNLVPLPAADATVAVTGAGDYTTPVAVTATMVGTYHWTATYSGDANNNRATEPDTDAERANESVTVTKASPAIATAASLGGPVGTTTLTDSVTISGGYNTAGGTITFTLTPPSGPTMTVGSVTVVTGTSTYTSQGVLATQVGTYTWHATYSEDGFNNVAIDQGGAAEQALITKASPGITTTPSMTAPTTGGGVCPGEFATIGFWHNQNGQAVINSFNGGPTQTALGNWLATTFPHLFGASNPYIAGSLAQFGKTSLAGMTNAQVAATYLNLWTPSGVTKNTYVQGFAVALGMYASTTSLGGASLLSNGLAAMYGFVVTASGGQGATWTIGGDSNAFNGQAGSLTVLQSMQIVDANFSTSTGNFYGGDQGKTSSANDVLNGINSVGDIPGGNCSLICSCTGTGNGSGKLMDSATVSGGYNLTGTVTFYLFAPGVTPNGTYSNYVYSDTVTIGSGGTASTATGTNPGGYTPTAAGTYQWVAVYSGDGSNVSVTSPYGSEPWTVGAANPSVNTIDGGTVLLGSGGKLTDSAMLAGGVNPTGTVTFVLFAPGVTPNSTYSNYVYTDTVSVSGNGTYTTSQGDHPGGYLPTATGTYQWVVFYSGDGNNAPALSPYGDEPETVVAPAVVSGTVYCDTNLNGVLDAGEGPEAGAVVTLAGASGSQTYTTGTNGTYQFSNLVPGSYTVTLTTPTAGHAAEVSHGTVVIPSSQTVVLASGGSATGKNFAEVDYGSVSGYVYLDVDDDGVIESGESGIGGVTVTLTGTNYLGTAVSRTTTTSSAGLYSFPNLLPSGPAGYSITETQPAGYLDGVDAPGKVNGVTVGTVSHDAVTNKDYLSGIVLPGCNNDAVNYNFGEHGIFHGLTATIGFWHNQNGQGLIKSFGTTSNGLTLSNWLATTYPNLFGNKAPAFNVNSTTGTNLTNRSDTDVANYFLSLFNVSGQKSYAQVLATALAVFTTTNSLNTGAASRTLADKFGFARSITGSGSASFAVPQADWQAFGITSSSGATQTIAQLLVLANKYASAGKLNNNNTTLITETNDVFNAINNKGDIGTGMNLMAAGGGGVMTGSLGQVYAGTYLVSVDGLQGPQAAAQAARIADAIAELDESLASFGVVLAELDSSIAATPDVQIHLSATTDIGGLAQGILGVTQVGGLITLVSGWNWYAGADAAAVGGGQYDFQTVVTHELGHAIGLGHSPDATSVMYPELATGAARRDLSVADLASLHADADAGTGPEALMAVPAPAGPVAMPPVNRESFDRLNVGSTTAIDYRSAQSASADGRGWGDAARAVWVGAGRSEAATPSTVGSALQQSDCVARESDAWAVGRVTAGSAVDGLPRGWWLDDADADDVDADGETWVAEQCV